MNIPLKINNMFRSITLLWIILAASQGLSARDLSSYVPQVSPTSGEPPCAHGRTYCEEVQHYPADVIVKLLKSAPSEITSFLNNSKDTDAVEDSQNLIEELPVVLHVNMSSSAMKKKDEQLCQSHAKTVKPLVARNDLDEWRYIVNLDDYKQLLEIEICTNEARKCNIGYRKQTVAICEQKMVARRLLALDPSGNKLTWHNGMLPSCCQCTLYDEPRLLL